MEFSRNTIIYTDYNCPFCFALHEQVNAQDLLDNFEWRLIQHAPHASSHITTYEDQTELAGEVAAVRKKAPDVNISLPSFRPNTELATKATISAYVVDPIKAATLRTLIYQAYWQQGLDISKQAILDPLLQQANLEDLDFTEGAEAITSHYQISWEKGDFARRIPSMRSVEGNVFLGFPSLTKLKGFLEAGISENAESKYVCKMRDKQKILFVHEGSKTAITLRNQLANEFKLEDTFNASQAIRGCESESVPDLILLDCTQDQRKGYAVCRELMASVLTQSIPIIALTGDHDPEEEIKYFELGASDYITYPCNHQVIRARLRTHLRLRRSSLLLEKLAQIDPVTQIRNRREFDRIYGQEWQRAVRSEYPITLLMVSIKDFKAFSDDYGHQLGDEALQLVAECLEDSLLRAGDSVFRYDYEDFVIIFPQQNTDNASHISQRITECIKAGCDVKLPSGVRPLSVHQGISCVTPTRNGNPTDLIKLAEDALRNAKQQASHQPIE